MIASPKFAHVVFQTSQPEAMRDWYCTVLNAHVVYESDALAFLTFDEEHHRVALLKSPVSLERKTPSTAAMHHVAYTFTDLDDLLARYEALLAEEITPAVSIAHGPTASMYYRDPDGNFVEMQVDLFTEPDAATEYMNGPEFSADPVGPAFDPAQMLRARRAGVPAEVLTSRAWARQQELPDPMAALIGAE